MVKRLISILFIIIFLFTVSGCSDDKQNIINDTTTQYIPETTTYVTTETTTFAQNTEMTTEKITNETTTQLATEQKMTDSQIIELYKNAASKSNSTAKSVQKISMKDFSVDNGGAINSIMKMFLPVISKVVESNSTEFNGITGGYTNLTAEDISSVSYSENGDEINIKFNLKEQTDIGNTDINSGTVGHGISVIGDLSSVFIQLKDSGIPISVNNEDIVMTYKNAQIDVTVDKYGNIANGSWSYDVTLDLNNFSVGGTVVPKATVIISNQISVN